MIRDMIFPLRQWTRKEGGRNRHLYNIPHRLGRIQVCIIHSSTYFATPSHPLPRKAVTSEEPPISSFNIQNSMNQSFNLMFGVPRSQPLRLQCKLKLIRGLDIICHSPQREPETADGNTGNR
jgi:hypothetical protein